MFSAFFITRPKFALVIAIVMTLAGAIAINVLPISEYPPIAPPQIVVSGVYAGASAEVVEQSVGAPIEEVVNGVEGMIYMSSKSSNDGSYSLNEIGGLSMAKHEREATDKKRDAHPESDEARANPKVIETGEKLKDEIDDLVDEIDQVLEENAEEFVKNYVQKGGQ